MVSLTLLAAMTIAEPAGAQGVSSANGAESPQIVLDPTDFDPRIITETEVTRMRSQLMAERWSADMVDQAAGRQLAEARRKVAGATVDLDEATARLSVLERTLGAAAIEGYLADIGGEAVAVFGLQADAEATLADETATQLLQHRAEARAAVVEATEELERTEESERVAEARKIQAERSLERFEVKQSIFDDLADEHVANEERADAAAAAISEDVDLASVAGAIIVNAEIEDDIDRLIANARADGLVLSGGGYRTIESQIALRLSHCGGGGPAGVEAPGEEATPEELAAFQASLDAHRQYVIYEAPSSSCSPPTATPGNSQHQQGLAIDFTQDGAILGSSSEAFHWMVENAADYGLINLPSEAWHWSTTGS